MSRRHDETMEQLAALRLRLAKRDAERALDAARKTHAAWAALAEAQRAKRNAKRNATTYPEPVETLTTNAHDDLITLRALDQLVVQGVATRAQIDVAIATAAEALNDNNGRPNDES